MKRCGSPYFQRTGLDPSVFEQKAVQFMWARLSAVTLFVLTVQPLAFSQQATPTLRLLSSVNTEGFGVSAYKNLAFTGMRSVPGSIAIVGISDPTAPHVLGHTPSDPDANFEELRALRIGQRDVLVVCHWPPRDFTNHTVLKIFDIDNPADPRLIGTYNYPWGGLHFEIARQRDRTLVLLSSIGSEALTSNNGQQQPGLGDLFIIDISDPTNPVMVGEWGVIDEPLLGLDVYLNEQRGTSTRNHGEDVWVSPDGRTAYYAYCDFGVMILDISDPSRPKFLGRVGYEADEEGQAFEVRTVKDGSVLVRSSYVRNAFRTEISSNAFEGIRSAGEDGSTPAIYVLPSHQFSAEVVRVGSGCSLDAYLADPYGAVALIEEGGGCTSSALKVGLAQKAGATGVILYNPKKPGGFTDSHDRPQTNGRFEDPDTGLYVDIIIPAVAVGWNTGSCLGQVEDGAGELVASDCEPTSPVTIDALSVFHGYGRLDIFDIRNPSAPVKLSTFSTPRTMDVSYALEHRYPPCINLSCDISSNHLEVSGNTIYAGWLADGLRVINLSNPSAPREIASWTGQGASPSDRPLMAWDLVRHRDLILLNSYYHGLYILEDVR
jgi:hypothetical protein